MVQLGPLDNPEYANLIRRLLDAKEGRGIITTDLMKDKKSLVERKNISRKMKKLENLGLIQIETRRHNYNPKAGENAYFVDYLGFANIFSQFLYRDGNFIKIGQKWRLNINRFSENEGRKFKKFIEYHLKQPVIQEKSTIRQMFYEIMMISYAYAMDKKKSNGFDEINDIIRNSMAAERFKQMSSKTPFMIAVNVNTGIRG